MSGRSPSSVYMRTGEMKLVPVWVRFGLSDRSEKSGQPEILMSTEFCSDRGEMKFANVIAEVILHHWVPVLLFCRFVCLFVLLLYSTQELKPQ